MLSLSHEVHPAAPEFERTSTTVVNAYVGPPVQRYLKRLTEQLKKKGFAHELLVMQSSGGIATASSTLGRPIATLASGPGRRRPRRGGRGQAGGRPRLHLGRHGRHVVRRVPGPRGRAEREVLVELDQPVPGRAADGRRRARSAPAAARWPRSPPGALQVGPQSAGSDPGPICYGRGGTEPTVTDANLVLGYLNPENFAGGEFPLKADGLAEVIEKEIGAPLGLNGVEAAWGIHRLVNANMNNAIVRVSAERGLDPREFALLVFGGNGAVHALHQAEELGIRRVVIPRTAPAFSALGLLVSDYLVDRVRATLVTTHEAAAGEARGDLRRARDDGHAELTRADLPSKTFAHQRFAQVRYPGQTWDIDVPVKGTMDAKGLARLAERFHHDARGPPHLRAPRRDPADRGPPGPLVGPAEGAAAAEDARVDEAGAAPEARARPGSTGSSGKTKVYDGPALRAGQSVKGPAIIEEPFTTVVIPPGWTAKLDRQGNYVATRGGSK